MRRLPLLCLPLLLAAPSLTASARQGADDPLELLWSDRLEFAEDGSPLVSVRIDEGREELSVIPREPATIRGRGAGAVSLKSEAGITWRFRVRGGSPALVRYAPQVAEPRLGQTQVAQEELERWRERGFRPQSKTIGGTFGIGGKVIDTRRYAILLAEPGPKEEAERLLDEAQARYGEPLTLYSELVERPRGTIEILDEGGALVATSEGAAVVEARGERGITVLQVEHDHGYAAHGREDRSYRGKVVITVDSSGKAAAVSLLPLESLLRGIVPSEIFASAPGEALQAQAVAARGEVLAKIGARHRADPWLLCAEQHCQVYKGRSGEHPRTDEAIARSRGELLFGKGGGGALVDSVYSSTCGGHTENNEVVWGTPPDPNLRGVPDLISLPAREARRAGRSNDAEVVAFLAEEEASACKTASFARQDKFRWERRFSDEEVGAIASGLGVGKVQALVPGGRGTSGRASRLLIRGDQGEATVEGELVIRRLFRNLNSSLFVVERDLTAGSWTFRGGGWGHGVGMCQMGAIGRAEQGQDHRAILRHYYGGAELIRLY